jgi:ferredoxin
MIPEHVRYPYYEVLYNRVGHVVHDFMLEFIGQMVGQLLMSHGYATMIFPTTGLHPHVEGMTDVEIWEEHTPFRYTFGPFSHRHAATRAGLGEFGYNNLVLTKEFGPRQRFNSIITDAPLAADAMVTEPICLRDECRLCLKACIVECITLRDEPHVRDYRSLDRDEHTRIFIDTPARTDPTLCRRRREGRPHSPIRGDCARVCPVPQPRSDLPEHLSRMIAAWQDGKN